MRLLIVMGLVTGLANSASAQEIRVLSAGAVEPGLRAALALYEQKTAITFNTAPQIRERIEKKGEQFDVVVAPPAVMDAFAHAGRVEPERAMLGRVGQGLAVRADAPVPDVSTLEAMKRALLEAESVVFNRATGGQYIESMLRKIGIYEEIEKKTTRYASAGEVMDHLLKGKGREIGFGPIPEIALYKDKGVRYAGPLPHEVQQYNAYAAAAMRGATSPQAAAALVRFLGTPAARQALVSGGVE